jgi:hypothetical protein
MESAIKFDLSPAGKNKRILSEELDLKNSSLDKLSDLVNGLLRAYHKCDILEHLNNEEEDKIERL